MGHTSRRMAIALKGSIAALGAIAGISSTVAGPAQAFIVTRNNTFGNLLTILLGDTTGLSNFGGRVDGHRAAFGIFEDDPFGLGSGIVLSTGRVVDLPGRNRASNLFTDGADFNTDLPGFDRPNRNLYDIAQLEISFDVDNTVDQLFFQYVFGSEEFLEYAGTRYNDFFTLELNGQNLALLTDSVGATNTVGVNNLAASEKGPFSADYIDYPAGPNTKTRLDGFTRALTFTGNLSPNSRNTLKITIADVSDPYLDSAVFLKAKTFGTVEIDPPGDPGPNPPQPKPPSPDPDPEIPPNPSVDEGGDRDPVPPTSLEPTPVPEPTALLGMAIAGGLGALLRRCRE
ncbi:MAG: PEP-CTERM sorting domain-containing protein [Leptolyngbyaceae cyanobacterium T60_A2020_046]|nr:PEP-CTERM sorting domain-containing protein [Leptolyngbyaceae cyanobacterium T60_A2020_046]